MFKTLTSRLGLVEELRKREAYDPASASNYHTRWIDILGDELSVALHGVASELLIDHSIMTDEAIEDGETALAAEINTGVHVAHPPRVLTLNQARLCRISTTAIVCAWCFRS